MELARKMIGIGNSLGFTIDKATVKVLRLKKGDYIRFQIKKVYKSG